MAGQLPIAAAGTYAPRLRCFYCGARHVDVELEKGVIRELAAYGWKCADVVACCRRRQKAKQLKLFGAA